jgi:hydrogenase maturation protease
MSWRVIALGNPARGDDALGPLAAAALAKTFPHLPILHREATILLLDDWQPADSVLLIDAAAPLGQPGRIHRLNLATDALPPTFSTATTHGFGLAETLHLARALHRLPAHLILYAVEGESFTFNTPLSPPAAAALPRLLERITQELTQKA